MIQCGNEVDLLIPCDGRVIILFYNGLVSSRWDGCIELFVGRYGDVHIAVGCYILIYL